MQNYNIMNAWPDYMAPYQRNLLSFQPINQFNPVMQQNVSPFTGFLNGLANFNQNNLQQRPTQLAVDKIKERKDLDEERKMLIKIIESQKQNQLNMFQKPER